MDVGEDGFNVLFVHPCVIFSGMAGESVGECSYNIETEFDVSSDITRALSNVPPVPGGGGGEPAAASQPPAAADVCAARVPSAARERW